MGVAGGVRRRDMAMVDWQPIATAPKGRRVLLYLPNENIGVGNWYCQTGEYHDDYAALEPQPFWRIDSDERGTYSRAHQPTHWMPLPDPPTPREDQPV
jgi:hypothetical protein